MEEKIRKTIEKHLNYLVGQKMTRLFRWEVMTCYVFEDSNGDSTEIHTYSRCLMTHDNEVIIDSNNVVEPSDGVEPNEECDYGIGESVFDDQFGAMRHMFPLTVLSAEVKDDGTIRMRLSDGCFFSITPWPDVEGEEWRIFTPFTKKRCLCFYGNGTIAEDLDY